MRSPFKADDLEDAQQVDGNTKKVFVPGARAPTVKVPAFLNSWLRVLAKHGSSLGSFVRTFLSNVPQPREEAVSLGPLWPIPAPYPEVFGRDPAFGGSWKKRRLVVQVLVLSWLYLGKPSVCPIQLWVGRSLTARQWRRVRLLEDLSEDSNSLLEVDAAGMARAAIKAESSADQLDSLHRALLFSSTLCSGPYGAEVSSVSRAERENAGEDGEWAAGLYGAFVGTVKADQTVVAKPIQADRLSFVGCPGFDPLPYLDPVTAHAYESPLDCVRHHGLEPPPAVSVHGSVEERNKLYKRMAESGRLVPVLEGDVREGLVCGLFAVPKDLERDRLILDARPPNTVEPVLSSWTRTMSSSTCLLGFELEEGESLIMSGRDIRDFFYQFQVSPQRCLRNVLAGRLAASDLEFIFKRPFDGPGYVGLSTLAMGDLNACEFAQGSHLRLILACGGALPSEVMMMHRPCPRGLLSVGVVIDDLVCFEKVLSSDLVDGAYAGRSMLDERMEAIMAKYEEVRLPTNPKKAFDNATCSSFWGVQVDGKKGTVRGNESRLWPLLLITMRVCCLGLSTVGLLRSLAGSYISVLTLRRRLLSVMNLIFDAIAASNGDAQVVRLSGTLKDELFTMMVLATLAVVNLRARTLGCVRATDASDWGMAAVVGEVPVAVAREALRLSLSKSCWIRLLPPGKAWLRAKELLHPSEELPGDEEFDVHPFWEQLARSVEYKELWRKKHVRPVHVNSGPTSVRRHGFR